MAALIPYRGKWITAQQLRRTYDWKQLAKRICQPGALCGLCGQEIIYGLRANHPLGPTVDHIIALEVGGAPLDPMNCQPAHRRCNSSKQHRAATRDVWSDW